MDEEFVEHLQTKVRNLERGLETRTLIGQATGILMERYRMTGERAFAVLVRIAGSEGTKVHEVARRLVTTGELGVAESGAAVASAVTPGRRWPHP